MARPDPSEDPEALAEALVAGDRRALARAITLVESARPDHRRAAARLLDAAAGSGREALRVGLSGTPGVGKSTFIEALGLSLTGDGKRVAVLAVDPTSSVSGGSILGDKTRMERLSRDRSAFIRPSPAGTALGGVAARTRAAVAVVEAAGFDVVIVETVGVGQSETLVAGMTDVFLLLLAPGGGDELQGVKRGIMEVADLILVNKADGPRRDEATRTAADYAGALRLMRRRAGDPPEYPMVRTVSAEEGTGLAEAWRATEALVAARRDSGRFAERRSAQARSWFEEEVREGLLARLTADPGTSRAMEKLAEDVAAGRRAPAAAAADLLAESAAVPER